MIAGGKIYFKNKVQELNKASRCLLRNCVPKQKQKHDFRSLSTIKALSLPVQYKITTSLKKQWTEPQYFLLWLSITTGPRLLYCTVYNNLAVKRIHCLLPQLVLRCCVGPHYIERHFYYEFLACMWTGLEWHLSDRFNKTWPEAWQKQDLWQRHYNKSHHR